jgi:hypothetical protein
MSNHLSSRVLDKYTFSPAWAIPTDVIPDLMNQVGSMSERYRELEEELASREFMTMADEDESGHDADDYTDNWADVQ